MSPIIVFATFVTKSQNCLFSLHTISLCYSSITIGDIILILSRELTFPVPCPSWSRGTWHSSSRGQAGGWAAPPAPSPCTAGGHRVHVSIQVQVSKRAGQHHRVHIFTRDETAHSAGAYTATLLVMVNLMKGGGRAPPTLTSLGKFYPHDECTLESSVCYSVYSVGSTSSTVSVYSWGSWSTRQENRYRSVKGLVSTSSTVSMYGWGSQSTCQVTRYRYRAGQHLQNLFRVQFGGHREHVRQLMTGQREGWTGPPAPSPCTAGGHRVHVR